MTAVWSDRDAALVDATRRLNLSTAELDAAHAELDAVTQVVRSLRDPSVAIPQGLLPAVGRAAGRVVAAVDAREGALAALAALNARVDKTVPLRVGSGV